MGNVRPFCIALLHLTRGDPRGVGGVWGAPRLAGMALVKEELATALAWSCQGDLLLVATNKVTNDPSPRLY